MLASDNPVQRGRMGIVSSRCSSARVPDRRAELPLSALRPAAAITAGGQLPRVDVRSRRRELTSNAGRAASASVLSEGRPLQP
jgi:hypothetical protein